MSVNFFQYKTGRSNLEVKAGHRHWVFEFKVVRDGESAANKLGEAVGQITSRGYGLQQDNFEVICMAPAVSISERKFVKWVEVLQDCFEAVQADDPK